jgi:hypothetical protein
VSGAEDYIEVRTVISSTVKTAFAHFFYNGDVRNTVEAVARATTAFSVNAGGSLTHLSTDCSTPLRFDGGGSSEINFDGAFSNGCVRKDGNGDVNSDAPVTYLDECDGWGNNVPKNADNCPTNDPNFPTIVKGTEEFPKYYLEEENSNGNVLSPSEIDTYWDKACPASSGTAAAFESTGTLSPGRYTEFSSKKNGTVVTLQSGLYCFDGNFDPGSGTTVQSAADGVTIILLGGSFVMNGNATVILTASQEEGYENLLFYGAKYNDNVQSFLGSVDPLLKEQFGFLMVMLNWVERRI